MAIVTVSITPIDAASQPTGPAGVKPGLYRYQIRDTAGNVVQSHDDASLTVNFSGVPEGSFTAFAEILDSTGAEVPGLPTVQAAFEVPVLPVQFPAPQSISVTLS